MSNGTMQELREQLDSLNLDILNLISRRAEIVQQIGEIKSKQSTRRFDPVRERDMLNHLFQHNDGPLKNSTVEHIFKEIFKIGLRVQEDDKKKALLVSRERKESDTVVDIKGLPFGNGDAHFIFGPCAVESYEQVAAVAESVKSKGLKLLRGGS